MVAAAATANEQDHQLLDRAYDETTSVYSVCVTERGRRMQAGRDVPRACGSEGGDHLGECRIGYGSAGFPHHRHSDQCRIPGCQFPGGARVSSRHRSGHAPYQGFPKRLFGAELQREDLGHQLHVRGQSGVFIHTQWLCPHREDAGSHGTHRVIGTTDTCRRAICHSRAESCAIAGRRDAGAD